MPRILAIDYGRAHLGLAVSDATNTLASPLPVLDVKHPRAAIPDLKRIVAENDVGAVVIGLPLDQNGDDSEIAAEVRAWAATLGRAVPATVILRDERFTSQWADRLIAQKRPGAKRKAARAQRDAMAAEAILQNYLDSLRHAARTGE